MLGSDRCAMVRSIAMSGDLASAIAGRVRGGHRSHADRFSGGLSALKLDGIESPLLWDLQEGEVASCMRVCFGKDELEVTFDTG